MVYARDLNQTGSIMIAGRCRIYAPSDISPSEDSKCRVFLDFRLVQPMKRDNGPRKVLTGVPRKKKKKKKAELQKVSASQF